MEKLEVSDRYLKLRKQILDYTNEDMNLKLDNDEQVYIALIDIPVNSNIIGYQTQSLALVFGLNTHIYHGSGAVMMGLERESNVKRQMQSFLINSSQVIKKMTLTHDIDFYNSRFIRIYLKTKRGIYFKELDKKNKEDNFIEMLLNCILIEINKSNIDYE